MQVNIFNFSICISSQRRKEEEKKKKKKKKKKRSRRSQPFNQIDLVENYMCGMWRVVTDEKGKSILHGHVMPQL